MKFTIEKSYPHDRKMSPQLNRLFAKAAAGEIAKDEKISLIMRAKDGYKSEHFDTRTSVRDIQTGEATLEQVEELIKDRDVYYIETPTRMFLR